MRVGSVFVGFCKSPRKKLSVGTKGWGNHGLASSHPATRTRSGTRMRKFRWEQCRGEAVRISDPRQTGPHPLFQEPFPPNHWAQRNGWVSLSIATPRTQQPRSPQDWLEAFTKSILLFLTVFALKE